MVVEILDGVTKTTMLGNGVKRLCRLLRQDQQTVVISREQLVERTTAERVSFVGQQRATNTASVIFSSKNLRHKVVRHTLAVR